MNDSDTRTVAVCQHCDKPIMLVEREWGPMWVHHGDGLTGLCDPLVLAAKLTHAEPR